MRGKRAKFLRKQAIKEEGKDAYLYLNNETGVVIWDGWVRRYRDLKTEWKERKR